MKINDFINDTPVSVNDLYGTWIQKGFDATSPDASAIITKRLTYIKTHFAKHIKKNPISLELECKFKREKVPGASVGEWMAIYDGDKIIAEFTASAKGFINEMDAPAQDDSKDAPTTDKPDNTTIENAIDNFLNVGWVNKPLMEKLNKEAELATVEYHNKKNPGTYDVA